MKLIKFGMARSNGQIRSRTPSASRAAPPRPARDPSAPAPAQVIGTRALFRAGGDGGAYVYAGALRRDGVLDPGVPVAAALAGADLPGDPPSLPPRPAMAQPPGAPGLVVGALGGSVEAARAHNAARVAEPGWAGVRAHRAYNADMAAVARELGWDDSDVDAAGGGDGDGGLADEFYRRPAGPPAAAAATAGAGGGAEAGQVVTTGAGGREVGAVRARRRGRWRRWWRGSGRR
jgi:hypothetical protein